MTRKEREEIKAMSLDVYGNASFALKSVRKGEYRQEQSTTNNGNPITVKRWYPITTEEAKSRMETILVDRTIVKAKASLELKKTNEGGPDGSQEKTESV